MKNGGKLAEAVRAELATVLGVRVDVVGDIESGVAVFAVVTDYWSATVTVPLDSDGGLWDIAVLHRGVVIEERQAETFRGVFAQLMVVCSMHALHLPEVWF